MLSAWHARLRVMNGWSHDALNHRGLPFNVQHVTISASNTPFMVVWSFAITWWTRANLVNPRRPSTLSRQKILYKAWNTVMRVRTVGSNDIHQKNQSDSWWERTKTWTAQIGIVWTRFGEALHKDTSVRYMGQSELYVALRWYSSGLQSTSPPDEPQTGYPSGN